MQGNGDGGAAEDNKQSSTVDRTERKPTTRRTCPELKSVEECGAGADDDGGAVENNNKQSAVDRTDRKKQTAGLK